MKKSTVSADGETITVHVPMTFRKRGGRKLVVTPDGAAWAPRPRVDNAMVKALARAFRWRKELETGVYATLEDLASFIRQAIALAATKGRPSDAAVFAEARWGSESRAAAVAKSAISVSDLGAAGSSYAGAAAEWVAQVREASIVGRARFLRTALRVRTLAMADATTAAWLPQGAAIPISIPTWSPAEVAPRSLSVAAVVTQEALREGGAAFEDELRLEMTRAAALAVDEATFDPENDGSAHAPASVLNGAPETAATGDLADDLQAIIGDFSGDLT